MAAAGLGSVLRVTGDGAATGHRGTRRRTLVSMLAAFLLICGVIVTSATTAQAAPPDSHRPATWNMNQSSSRWAGVYSLTEHHDVVALQEVPLHAPSASERLRDIRGIERYRWRESDRDPYRYLFILRHSSRNIGIVTRWLPSNTYEIPGVYRPALAVAHRGDGVLFASVHAESPGGNDTGALLRRIADTARSQNLRWAAVGDFNRRPEGVPTLRDLPTGYRIYNPGQATHANGGEYDYMISNINTDNWQSTVRANSTSDHWPVQFGSPRAGGDPVELKVMPTGDSITRGTNHSTGDGYRDFLWADLMASSIVFKRSLDFVGTQRSGDVSDADHEGHPGWRIDQIADVADCSVASFRPNVILLHAGTNDMNQNHQLDSAPERLRGLVNQILADAPEATVLVATLIPSTKEGMQAKIDRYNAAVPGVVRGLRNEGKRVRLVDMASALTPEDVDGSHPDDEGYRKMAYVWLDALYSAADEGLLQNPVPGTGTACTGEEESDPVSAAGPGWRPLGVIAPGMGTPAGRTDLAEMNGDNRADYVRITDDGSVRVALNTVGEPGKPHWVDRGTFPSPRAEAGTGDRVRFADLDGNGVDDYLLLGEGGQVQAWFQTADGRWNHGGVVAPGVQGASPEAIRFADVNGDGRDDYLRTGTDGSIHAYINTVGATSIHWVERLNWAPGVWYGSRDKLRLADVNGDKKADYLMVGGTGAVHAYFNDGGGGGGGFTPHLYFVNETGYPGAKSTFRDISGDGKADYVVIYDGGSIRCWLNRGGNID
ncbi:GDSL-type esterase/lipase family protein [Streptomyces hirsutus]|uniref:GDSL-type esterase/lipase family protein n=1 Tax=Streptomyces hirsutus TaxID=35620 RepID=UPI0036D11DE1